MRLTEWESILDGSPQSKNNKKKKKIDLYVKIESKKPQKEYIYGCKSNRYFFFTYA